MSAFGQKQTIAVHQPISALPPKADIESEAAGIEWENGLPRRP
jgi:hypothetical protein